MLKLKPLLIFVLMMLVIITGCGENKSSFEKVQSNISAKSVCDLLSKEEVSKIMEVAFEESTQTLHTVNTEAGSYVSQCAYYTNNGLQHIAVLVRYFKETTFPQSAEEFLSASKVGDAELDQEIEQAMKNYVSVEGLGDFAFYYSLWESNSLVIHWDQHYEMIISMHDFSFDPTTLEKIKQVAKGVMKKMN